MKAEANIEKETYLTVKVSHIFKSYYRGFYYNPDTLLEGCTLGLERWIPYLTDGHSI